MKVRFDTSLINNTYPNGVNLTKTAQNRDFGAYNTVLPNSEINYAYFPNISFRGNSEAEAMLKLSDMLLCAYLRKPLMRPSDYNKLSQKLNKRPNIQSAINLLQNYMRYLYDVESQVFDLFLDAPHKNKMTFDRVLQMNTPDSLDKLKYKEIKIINSANNIIPDLSNAIREEIVKIRDYSIDLVDEGSFKRKIPLKLLSEVKGSGQDDEIMKKIYRVWYRLPRSSRDYDAFVVNYSTYPHESIARRLIAPSKASIEHITPQSRNGADSLENYLLASSLVNNERSSIPLDEYIMLNPSIDIPNNLQLYLNDFIEYINRKFPMFMDKSHYPEAIQKSILEETNGFVVLDTSNLKLTKSQIKENHSPQRLGQKYTIIEK